LSAQPALDNVTASWMVT